MTGVCKRCSRYGAASSRGVPQRMQKLQPPSRWVPHALQAIGPWGAPQYGQKRTSGELGRGLEQSAQVVTLPARGGDAAGSSGGGGESATGGGFPEGGGGGVGDGRASASAVPSAVVGDWRAEESDVRRGGAPATGAAETRLTWAAA
jgi:hypothetical protein